MIKTSKHIGSFFVWMAMLVIIGHSVIPHHHHSDVVACEQSCDHEGSNGDRENPGSELISSSTHQCETSHEHRSCESCQFETTATTPLSKIAVDYSLLVNHMLRLMVFPRRVVTYFDCWSNHYSFHFTGHSLSRGPPALV